MRVVLSPNSFSLNYSSSSTLNSPTLCPIPQVSPLRLTQTTTIPSYFHMYHVGILLPIRNIPSFNLALVKITGISYLLFDVFLYDKSSPKHHAFTISLSIERKPTSFAQAICDPKWCLITQQELLL